MSKTVDLAKQLINIESVTPNDNGCQTLLREKLAALGFTITDLSRNDVNNTLAIRGNTGPLFLFTGHTDVVPPGPLNEWRSAPFTATERDGNIYGRGSADMKSSIAAMICAFEDFINANPTPPIRLAMAITSDEEGIAIDGSTVIVDYLKQHNIIPDYVLVGEATCDQTFGDMIKIGRRGSLSGRLTITGKQCHIAYPHHGQNPIHIAGPIIKALSEHAWDQGNPDFQATSFQISNINAGTGATNVIPEDCVIDFNFRFCPESTSQQLRQQTEAIINILHQNWHIDWQRPSESYYSQPGALRQACTTAIEKLTNITPQASTVGGSSDGRFFATLGSEVIEFGPINASIHKINEHVNVNDLNRLCAIYLRIISLISVDTAQNT